MRVQAKEELGLLVYPYVQIVFGALRVASSPAYFPMRLTLLKFLTHVSACSKVYIPVSTYVLEIFDAADLQPGAKNAKETANPPPIEHVLKVSKQVQGFLRPRSPRAGLFHVARIALRSSCRFSPLPDPLPSPIRRSSKAGCTCPGSSPPGSAS